MSKITGVMVMKARRRSIEIFEGQFSAVDMAATLIVSVGLLLATSSGQSTHHDDSDIITRSYDTLGDLLGQLRHNVSRCAKNSDDVTAALNDIRRMTSSGGGGETHRGGAAECNCGGGCEAEIKSALAELSRDVTAIRSGASLEGQSSVTSYNPSRNVSVDDECYIDLRSSGCHDGSFKGSHVRVNWTAVHYSDAAGIYLAIVDPIACRGTPFPVVNPAGVGASAAQHLVTYINLLTVGQILVGATHHDALGNLGVASAALDGIGVKPLSRLNSCGKFAFVAQKGFPNKTVAAVKQAVEGNLWLVVKLQLGRTPADVTFIRLNDP